MQSDSLKHDHAMAMARAVLEIVAPCIREEERREAFNLFYEACKAGLEHYELKADRIRKRLMPGKN
jgi:hypothetical protein